MTIWHEVKNELPNNKDDVLVACLDSQSFAVAYYDGSIWRVDSSVFDEGNFRLTLAIDITHWSYLHKFNE